MGWLRKWVLKIVKEEIKENGVLIGDMRIAIVEEKLSIKLEK